MTVKPILFSGPMVRALLAGTKTQTRRLLSLRGHKSFTEFGMSDTVGYDWHFRDAGMRWHDLRDPELKARLRIQVGDRLWVKETSRITSWGEDGEVWIAYSADEAKSKALYADDEDYVERLCARVEKAGAELNADGWYDNIPPSALVRPSIFMPRWASRLTLRVTDVRVQRLQDISPGDSMAEGIQSTEHWKPKELDARPFEEKWWDDATFWAEYPPQVYRALWEAINGPGSWQANPWVAAYTFTVEMANVDAASEPQS